MKVDIVKEILFALVICIVLWFALNYILSFICLTDNQEQGRACLLGTTSVSTIVAVAGFLYKVYVTLKTAK